MGEPGMGNPQTEKTTRCCVCKRILKNPLSVELGIGPICRVRDDLQMKFDFTDAVEKSGHEGEAEL